MPDVPGANDNGSGIATLLTIAREIADREYPFTVRFIAFGAEELGLHGSQHYVDQLSDEEIDSTVAMLNFDALGSGPQTATLGTPKLLKMVDEYADEQGIDTKMVFTFDWGSSDHAAFHDAGIDHIFFLGEDFSRIHTPDDKLEFVETGASRQCGVPGDGADRHAGGGRRVAGLGLERLQRRGDFRDHFQGVIAVGRCTDRQVEPYSLRLEVDVGVRIAGLRREFLGVDSDAVDFHRAPLRRSRDQLTGFVRGRVRRLVAALGPLHDIGELLAEAPPGSGGTHSSCPTFVRRRGG